MSAVHDRDDKSWKIPARSTINDILTCHGLVTPDPKNRPKSFSTTAPAIVFSDNGSTFTSVATKSRSRFTAFVTDSALALDEYPRILESLPNRLSSRHFADAGAPVRVGEHHRIAGEIRDTKSASVLAARSIPRLNQR